MMKVGSRDEADITRGQANIALFVLLLTYMMSYVDRTALSVLQEPIKRELALSDWQLGLLSGPVFAVLYALMSLPIARLAERYSRSRLIAICLFLWSLMTLLCGLCQTYAQLLVARVGVSIGEAGGNPASHSLIADLFPPERRARAISIYTFGVPVGAFLGAALSGWLAARWGWRGAFMVLGPMGFVLVGFVLWLIPKVPRGRFDAAPADPSPPTTGAVLKFLAQSEVFRAFAAGAALVVLVGYGVAAFLPPFLIRVHGLGLAQVGLVSGLVNGVAAGVGTLFGGFAADHFGRRDVRFYGWMPGAAMMLATPCMIGGFLVGPLWLAAFLLMIGTACLYTYIAPTFARVHALAGPGMRATAAAVMFLIINLLGLGLGPPIIGSVSDRVAAAAFAPGDPASFARACVGEHVHGCAAAASAGITAGMIAVCLALPLSAWCFWRAGHHLGRRADFPQASKVA